MLPDPWNLDDEALRNTLTMTADRLYDNLDLGLDDDSVDSETQRPVFTKAPVFHVARVPHLTYNRSNVFLGISANQGMAIQLWLQCLGCFGCIF